MLESKNVLVTGASSGIGAATALLLAKKGYRVWGTTRNLDKLQTLPDELQKRVTFVAMDVAKDESVKRGVAQVLSEAGKIDILVNNAGYGVFGSVEEFPVEKAQEIFEVNYFGTLRVIQGVLPQMREAGSGLIINITSLAGQFVIPFQVHYSASKYAVEALTEGLRQETRNFGVKVVSIAPGDIKTNFNKETVFAPKRESPYQRWADACWKVIEDNMEKAPPPQVIARKVGKVVEKTNPRGSYVAGDFISTKFPLLNRLISSRFREKLTRVFYGIYF